MKHHITTQVTLLAEVQPAPTTPAHSVAQHLNDCAADGLLVAYLFRQLVVLLPALASTAACCRTTAPQKQTLAGSQKRWDPV